MKTRLHHLTTRISTWSLFCVAQCLGLSSSVNAQPAQGEISAVLGSNHLITGESVVFQIQLRGVQASRQPATPNMRDAQISFGGRQRSIINNSGMVEAFNYHITPRRAGTYSVPSIDIHAGGTVYKSPHVAFEVVDPRILLKIPTGIENVDILATWLPSKTTLYPGEQAEVTLKLYAPKAMNIVNFGMMEPKKENCLLWRFSSDSQQSQTVNIDDTPHITASFSSSLSGIAPGTASIKETNLPITIRQRINDPRYGSQLKNIELNLTAPDLDFTIKPFPSDAPKGFKGAVGQFQIASSCQKSSITSSETTEVLLQIGGTGNLAMLQEPALSTDSDSDLKWKVINTSKETRGSERREVSGVVSFRQLVRPLIDHEKLGDGETFKIPPYSLTYFDPITQIYRTISTDPIPMKITPGDEAPLSEEATETSPQPEEPEELMTEILPTISSLNTKNTLANRKQRSIPLWNIIPALLCLFIITLPLQRKLKTRFSKSPEQLARRENWKALQQATDDTSFYRYAGQYIEQWLPKKQDPELQRIIEERNQACFQSEKTSKLSSERKSEIIELLKKLTLLIAAVILLQPESLMANTEQSPENLIAKKSYQKAIDLYHESYPDSEAGIYNTPADVFYNLGNCYEKLGQDGKAALAWRRALAVDSTHTQARTNLQFIQQEVGALIPTQEPWQNKLTKLPQKAYRTFFQLSLWGFLLSLLCITVLKSSPWVRQLNPFLIAILVISPITASASYFGMHYYPDSSSDFPYTEQGVILQQAKLYPQAYRKNNSSQLLTEASLIQIIARRGNWTHIRVIEHSELQGWVKADKYAPIKSLTKLR